MPRPSGKATISLKGNAKNLPDIYFRELVQLYSRDCRTRGIEEVTIAGYEYACKKFLEYLQEDIRCSDLRQELFDDYQMELATRVKAETVNSYLFKISPVLKFGKERGYITADIQLSHMAYGGGDPGGVRSVGGEDRPLAACLPCHPPRIHFPGGPGLFLSLHLHRPEKESGDCRAVLPGRTSCGTVRGSPFGGEASSMMSRRRSHDKKQYEKQ